MVVRRTAEDRRRRVLREDKGADSALARRKKRSTGAADGRAYAEGAADDLQPRITEFLPLRRWTLAIWLLLGAVLIAGVEALFVAAQRTAPRLTQVDLSVLDLTGPTTLAGSLVSLWFVLAALVAMVVLCIRRHRIDDYKGHYRLWFWSAVALMWAALDAATGAHVVVRDLMVWLVEEPLWGDGAVWWMIGWALVAVVVGGRALWDMRGSFGSLFFATAATAAFVTSALVHLGVIRMATTELQAMTQVGLLMGGAHLIVFTLLVYGRYTSLQARGGLRISRPQPRTTTERWRLAFWRRRDGASQRSAQGIIKIRPISKRNSPPTEPSDAPGSAEVATEELDELDVMTNPDLTKAERRKLRKKLKSQNRYAA